MVIDPLTLSVLETVGAAGCVGAWTVEGEFWTNAVPVPTPFIASIETL
jgi:hypothetical protein